MEWRMELANIKSCTFLGHCGSNAPSHSHLFAITPSLCQICKHELTIFFLNLQVLPSGLYIPTPLLYSFMSLFWCLWDESFFLVGSVKFLTVFDPLNFHINVAYSFNKLLLPASLENSLPPHPFQIQLPSKFRPRSWLCYQMPICSWVNHMTASGFIFLTALYLPGRVAELIKWDKGVRVLLRAQNNKSDLGRAKHNNLSVIYNQHTVQTISSSVFSTLPQSLSPKLQALLCKALFSVGFIGTMG